MEKVPKEGKQKAGGLTPPPESEAGQVAFYALSVRAPLPRRVPYVFARRGPYVTQEAKEWRQAIAKACKKARVQKAPEGWTWHVEYTYCAKKDHADLDSLTHSAQDAVSKDYLHCVDKEFYGTYKRAPAIAPSAAHEETHLVFRLYPKARSVHLVAD